VAARVSPNETKILISGNCEKFRPLWAFGLVVCEAPVYLHFAEQRLLPMQWHNMTFVKLDAILS